MLLPEIIHFVIFNTSINYMSLMTLSDTNIPETADFFTEYITFPIVIKFLLIFIFPYCFVYFIKKPSIKLSVKSYKVKISFFIGIIIFIFTIPRDYVLREIQYINIYKLYNQVQYDKQLFIDTIKKSRKHNSFGAIDTSKAGDNVTYVIVIGESVDRNRMSIYGYERNTTPYFKTISSELFIFDDVISPHCHTSPSLQKILTFSDYFGSSYEYGSIIDFFNEAGFDTYWLSNQYKYGANDTGYTAIANSAKYTNYINTKLWSSNETTYYDGMLIPYLEGIINNDNTQKSKLIFIHLFGSHSSYYDRYPKEFNKYNTNKFLNNINSKMKASKVSKYNAYDNSILYTDYVLYSIINILKENNINGYMLYFSDHGEDAGSSDFNFYGHNEAISTKPMYEVPMILWLSERYKSNNTEKSANIYNSLHNPYQLDRLIHSVIDLSNMESDIFRPEDSIINQCFIEKERYYGNKIYIK